MTENKMPDRRTPAATVPPKRLFFAMPSVYAFFHGAGNGGAELQICQLAKLFAARGFEVAVGTNFPSPGAADESHSGVRLLNMQLRHFGGHSKRFFLTDTWNYCRRLKRFAPDAVLFKVPATLLFHLALAKLFSFGRIKICMIAASDKDFTLNRRGWLTKIMYEKLRGRIDMVICQTEIQIDLARKMFPADKLRLIPNVFVPPDPLPETGKDIDILWVGSFSPTKRIEMLLEFSKRLPHRNFTVISKTCPPDRAAVAEALKNAPNINYLEDVPFSQTYQYFSRAKLLLSTSTVEGFPNTFLQAWYCHTPVVSLGFACSGLPVKHEIGLLPGSEDECIQGIESLLNDPEKRAVYARNAHRYVVENHSPGIILDRYVQNLLPLIAK